LRSVGRARTDLVQTRVALYDQPRAHLRVVFTAVMVLFCVQDSLVQCHSRCGLLTVYPSPQSIREKR
jgi:hypothetical protein